MNIDLEQLDRIAESAGQAILEIYQRGFDIYEKDDKSPLTEADLAAHRLIVAELDKLEPRLPILSEESASIPFEERRRWLRYWLVDPLDGTKEFIKRNGEFTVNIALIESGRPSCGVVHVPVEGTSYYGCVGKGAWKRLPDGSKHAIEVAQQRSHPTRIAGSRSHAGDSLQRFLDNVGPHEILSMGSSLKLCLVAEGLADIYPRLGPTSEWDTGAAQAVVEAAGGQVTDLKMQPLRYNTKDSLLNPEFLVFGDAREDWSQYL
jgi:3'(2'), 5'-bisphosphate nucleotidase